MGNMISIKAMRKKKHKLLKSHGKDHEGKEKNPLIAKVTKLDDAFFGEAKKKWRTADNGTQELEGIQSRVKIKQRRLNLGAPSPSPAAPSTDPADPLSGFHASSGKKAKARINYKKESLAVKRQIGDTLGGMRDALNKLAEQGTDRVAVMQNLIDKYYKQQPTDSAKFQDLVEEESYERAVLCSLHRIQTLPDDESSVTKTRELLDKLFGKLKKKNSRN